MKIKFLGAAKIVTGSSYLITTKDTKFLIDFGLFQGGKKEELLNKEPLLFNPSELDFMILTHAHIDHSGRIPLLVKKGFANPIYSTKATSDLCEIMLLDSARIQESDIKWENKRRERSGKQKIEPLYTERDAEKSLHFFRPCYYREIITVNEFIKIRFQDAGHMLGSSIVEIWITEDEKITKLVFSGDLGMPTNPLLNDPTFIENTDYLIIESTYGNTVHENFDESVHKLTDIINRVTSRNGSVIIPSFAVGRTQEIIYQLNHYFENTENLPEHMKIPIYIDSPMAINATKAFLKNADDFNEKVRDEIMNGDNIFKFDNLHYVKDVEESIMLNKVRFPRVIISSSGMATGGRVRHHLKHALWDERNAVVFVGYQAEGSLGRLLLDQVKEVKLLGEEIAVNAEIDCIHGFSGHADEPELLDFISHFKMRPKKIFITHGELKESEPFKQTIEDKFHIPCYISEMNEEIYLEPSGIIQEDSIKQERTEADLNKDLEVIRHNFDRIAKKYRDMDSKSMTDEEYETFNSTINNLKNKLMILNMNFGK